jgi:hypothetical protein
MELTAAERDMLTSLEERMWTPAPRWNMTFQEMYFASDFTEFGASGRVYRRQDSTRAQSSTLFEAQFPLDALAFRMLDTNTVLLTYNSHVRYGEVTEHARRSSIWTKQSDGVWRMRFHQGTRYTP